MKSRVVDNVAYFGIATIYLASAIHHTDVSDAGIAILYYIIGPGAWLRRAVRGKHGGSNVD